MTRGEGRASVPIRWRDLQIPLRSSCFTHDSRQRQRRKQKRARGTNNRERENWRQFCWICRSTIFSRPSLSPPLFKCPSHALTHSPPIHSFRHTPTYSFRFYSLRLPLLSTTMVSPTRSSRWTRNLVLTGLLASTTQLVSAQESYSAQVSG